MAKTRSSYNGGSPGPDKKITVSVTVRSRGYGSGNAQGNNKAFEACAAVGNRGWGNKGTKSYECAYGKNPRKATAAALKKIAVKLNTRKGAFAGLGGMGGVKERRAARIVRSARRFKNLVVIGRRKR